MASKKSAPALLTIEPRGDVHELAAQVSRALKLCAALDAAFIADGLDPHAEAESIRATLESAKNGVWTLAALMQGMTPPSDATKSIVLAIYAARVLGRKLVPMLKAG